MRAELTALAESGADLAVQAAALKAGLEEQGLGAELIEATMSVVRPGFVVVASDSPTRSRAGGGDVVLLPTGESWPFYNGYPLTFMYELCPDEFVGADAVPGTPRDGSLLIFWQNAPVYTTWARGRVRVLFRASTDPGEPSTIGASEENCVKGTQWLRGYAWPGVDLFDVQAELAKRRGLAAAIDLVDPLFEALLELRPYSWTAAANRFLGPGSMRGGPLSRTVYSWFQRAETPEELVPYSPAEQKGEGWTLLFQPNNILGVDWTTAGNSYFAIPEADLHAGRYDRVIVTND